MKNSKINKSRKNEITLHRVTFNPSIALPSETLYVQIPNLNQHMLFVPKSVFLLFDSIIEKEEVDNHLVYNVSRNLVAKLKITFGGKTISDVDRADLFYGYNDLLKIKEDLMLGITSLEKIKIRSKNVGDSKILQFVQSYDTKYHIPLEHEILNDHGLFIRKD